MNQANTTLTCKLLAVAFMLYFSLSLTMIIPRACAEELEQIPTQRFTYCLPSCPVVTHSFETQRCPINASVGGVVVSVNKFDLVAPYIGLGLTITTPVMAIGTAKYFKRRKTQQSRTPNTKL